MSNCTDCTPLTDIYSSTVCLDSSHLKCVKYSGQPIEALGIDNTTSGDEVINILSSTINNLVNNTISVYTDDYFDNNIFHDNIPINNTVQVLRNEDTLYGLLDPYTNEQVTFTKVTSYINTDIDGVIIVKKGNEFFKRNERVNVRNFGAKLDGVTNDLPVLQKAVNTLSKYGMDVEIPEGTLYLNDNQGGISLPINKPATIRGAGVGKTIIKLSALTPRFADLNVQGLQNQTFRDIVISDFTIDANNVDDTITGQDTFEHIILGNQTRISDTGMNTSTTVVYLKNIRLENINVINAPTTPVASLTTPTTCIRWGVGIEVWGVGSKVENFRCNNVSINGADCGIWIIGQKGTFIDEVHLENCFHDRGVPSPTNYPSLNFMIGQSAAVNRVTMTNVVGRNAGDVGIEIDQPMIASLTNVLIEDAYGSNYYFENYESPARTVAGAFNTTLSNSGGINSSATSITVPSMPVKIDATGFLRIDNEIMYYNIVNATTLTVIRAFNNSIAASHSQNSVITFHESGRQHITLTNCSSRRNNSIHGSGIEILASNFLPSPNLTIRNFYHERTGDNVEHIGEGLLIDGFIQNLDIDGFTVNLAGNISTQNTALFLAAPSSYLHTNPIIKKSFIKTRNLNVNVSGRSSGTGTTGIGIHGGTFDLDVEMIMNANIKGSNNTTKGLAFGYYAADQIEGKAKIKMINTPNGDLAPVPVYVDYLGTIGSRNLELDLDLSQMWFSVTSDWSNYYPYIVSIEEIAPMVTLKRIQHSYLYSNVVASELIKGASVSGTYNLKLSDKYIGVDTNNTTNIVLPKMGGSFNQSPVIGFETTIKDEIGLAGTHNITITPFSGELIEGVSSKVINYAYGQVKLRWNGTKWLLLQNTSVLAGVNNNILPKSNGTNLTPSALSEDGSTLTTSLPFKISGSSGASSTLSHTGAGVDAKNWDFFAVGNRLYARLTNDANSAATEVFFIQRSGMTAQLVNFNVPVSGVLSLGDNDFVIKSQLDTVVSNITSTFSDSGFTI